MIRRGRQVGRLENAIGWYHSHPGYGCWLSGIDVSTQMLNQQFQEPFVAVVVRISGDGAVGGWLEGRETPVLCLSSPNSQQVAFCDVASLIICYITLD